MTKPTRTTDRLKDCCTVREAFSPGDRSDQRTAPVSLAIVTARLVGCGGALLVCSERAVEDVENVARAARLGLRDVRRPCAQFDRLVIGRNSWIASEGL